MSKENEPDARQLLDNRQLLESIHKIAEAVGDGPIRQIPLMKYKVQTPWHPSGDPVRPSLQRSVYLSGNRLREIFLSNEEIELLNKLKPGKYNGRRWTVVETDGDSENGSITILIPNKTPEDRVRLKGEAPDLATLCRKMIAESEAHSAQHKARGSGQDGYDTL